MSLRTNDVPKANEPVRLTTGLTLLNCWSPLCSGHINFRDNMSKFKTPGVNFKHLRNPSSNFKRVYVNKHSTQQKRLEKLVITYESYPFSSYLLFNKFNTSSKWMFIFTNEKKYLFLNQLSPPQQSYYLQTKSFLQ